MNDTLVLPYNGITSLHLLKPLIRQINAITKAAIIVHRDRDFLEAPEMEEWRKSVRATNAEPFITKGSDVEDYFCSDEYLKHVSAPHGIAIVDLKTAALDEQTDEIIASYVNGRVDIARKAGTIGKIDYGKLSADASKLINNDPWNFMKGKRKLARLRNVCREKFNFKYEIDSHASIPNDDDLKTIAAKNFKKPKAA